MSEDVFNPEERKEVLEDWDREWDERENKALATFKEKYPRYVDNCWRNRDVESVFKVVNFSYGIPFVIKRDSQEHGVLSFNEEFGARIYYNWRVTGWS